LAVRPNPESAQNQVEGTSTPPAFSATSSWSPTAGDVTTFSRTPVCPSITPNAPPCAAGWKTTHLTMPGSSVAAEVAPSSISEKSYSPSPTHSSACRNCSLPSNTV
jgi:hypothetical protein